MKMHKDEPADGPRTAAPKPATATTDAQRPAAAAGTRPDCRVREDEVELNAIRAQGAGGQNVNKVSNAVHLRFDIHASSLPEDVRTRLLNKGDQRVTRDGVVVIKAQEFRSLEGNRAEALRRLQELIDSVATLPRRRRPTRPTRSSVVRRLEGKTRRSDIKAGRGKVRE